MRAFNAAAALLILIAFSSRPTAAPAAAQTAPADRCRVDGRVTSGGVPLPGVSIGIRSGDDTRALTSSDVDGRYAIAFSPDQTYRLVLDFTGFTRVERAVTVGAPPCNESVDFQLALAPGNATPTAEAPARRQGPLPERRTASAGAASPTARGAQRFQTLNVQGDANALSVADAAPADDREIAALVPPGFGIESAQADAIAINGSGGATSLNRGFMNERLQAIDRGQLDPATGQLAQGAGFGDGAGALGSGGPGAGFGGRGGGPGGGRGGPGAFVLGGRGVRGQRPYQGSTTYTFGGSALDNPPFQLRPSPRSKTRSPRLRRIREEPRSPIRTTSAKSSPESNGTSPLITSSAFRARTR